MSYFSDYIKKRCFLLLVFFCIGCYLSLVNLTKLPISDAAVYREYIHNLSILNFSDIIYYRYYNIRESEFIFRLYSFLVSKIDASGTLFTFLSVFIIYFLTLIATFRLSKDYVNDNKNFIIIISVIFLGVTFSLTGHIIRQYLSVSVMYYLYSSYVSAKDGRKWLFKLLFIVVPPLIHMSSIAVVVAFNLIQFLAKKTTKRITITVSLLVSILLFLISGYISTILGRDGDTSAGQVSTILLIFDVTLVVLAVGVFLFRDGRGLSGDSDSSLFCLVLAIAVILITFYRTELIFLRLYFLLDFIRPILFLVLLSTVKLDVKTSIIFKLTCFLILLALFAYRVSISGWDYGRESTIEVFLNQNLVCIYERINSLWPTSE
ncbi:EpsG family protein [Vibrio sp. JZG10]